MAEDLQDLERLIRGLPIWTGAVDIAPLHGGTTNSNFVVTDKGRRLALRYGHDIPLHGVMRFNEAAAAQAAAAAGVSPSVVYASPPFLVMEYIDGRTYGARDVRENLQRCVALVKRAHRDMAAHLQGATLAFNPFHVIRSYARLLEQQGSRKSAELSNLLERTDALERAIGAIDLAFCHNDLLAANFIDDGERLWLVDWDYAGWNTPLFDLGGLSSNSAFDAGDDDAMLAAYFERPPDDALRCKLQAMKCVSLLRESLWSLVSENISSIDFDYVSYSDENLRRFSAAFARLKEMEGA